MDKNNILGPHSQGIVQSLQPDDEITVQKDYVSENFEKAKQVVNTVAEDKLVNGTENTIQHLKNMIEYLSQADKNAYSDLLEQFKSKKTKEEIGHTPEYRLFKSIEMDGQPCDLTFRLEGSNKLFYAIPPDGQCSKEELLSSLRQILDGLNSYRETRLQSESELVNDKLERKYNNLFEDTSFFTEDKKNRFKKGMKFIDVNVACKQVNNKTKIQDVKGLCHNLDDLLKSKIEHNPEEEKFAEEHHKLKLGDLEEVSYGQLKEFGDRRSSTDGIELNSDRWLIDDSNESLDSFHREDLLNESLPSIGSSFLEEPSSRSLSHLPVADMTFRSQNNEILDSYSYKEMSNTEDLSDSQSRENKKEWLKKMLQQPELKLENKTKEALNTVINSLEPVDEKIIDELLLRLNDIISKQCDIDEVGRTKHSNDLTEEDINNTIRQNLNETEILIQDLIQNHTQAQKRQYDENEMKEDKMLGSISTEQVSEPLNKPQKQVVSLNDENVQKLGNVEQPGKVTRFNFKSQKQTEV
ncbi:MAG: hypothetical protein OXD32_04630 [Endozoicomonadaceae bacterium]|nr:hypothetical protein [Endozoicomonadaceae bacterium]MCY4328794.1 hypothetical protein [Endozoicomonadaceae bacterium]